VKTATWTLLLAALIGGELTFAGCTSSPEELLPERSAIPSPVTADGFPQPAEDNIYYTVMASAAASAYPARFDANTEEEDGARVLRADPAFVQRLDLTRASRVTTYIDAHSLDRVRIIIAFRGTVHPTFTSPISNWTDIGTDISSQFFKKKHRNPLLPTQPVGRSGAGWETRWHNVANMKDDMNHDVFKDFIRDIAMESHRNRHMEINVVGHSLGGVVAELAGLDIEEYMRNAGMTYEVNVVAFNPPKLGSQDLVDEYRRRLKAQPDKFRISVFTREGDAVDDFPLAHIGVVVGHYHQVINNVAYDNLTTLCSPYMFGGIDNPDLLGAEGEARRLPYAPRLHVTKPFSYGSHSIDDWVGDRAKNVEYRQVLDVVNPVGFRCMFAPDTFGVNNSLAGNTPPEPKLNCSAYATTNRPSECNPFPPPPGVPRDEL
jgi:hypothetical protein